MKAILKLLVLGAILFFGNKYINEKGISAHQAADNVYVWIRTNWIKFSEIDTNKQVTDSIQNDEYIVEEQLQEETVRVKRINEKEKHHTETAMKRSSKNIYSSGCDKKNTSLAQQKVSNIKRN